MVDPKATIVCADARTWIVGRDPRSWAVLLIDPPYGIAYRCGSIPRGKFEGVEIEGDLDVLVRDEVLEWWGDGAAAVFGSRKIPHWGSPRCELVWDKGEAAGMGDMALPWKPNTDERIAIYGPGWHGPRTSSALRHTPVRGHDGKTHPHEKPVSLIADILRKAPPGPVLDLFAGSCATARAALALGRDVTCVEIESKWLPGQVAPAELPGQLSLL